MSNFKIYEQNYSLRDVFVEKLDLLSVKVIYERNSIKFQRNSGKFQEYKFVSFQTAKDVEVTLNFKNGDMDNFGNLILFNNTAHIIIFLILLYPFFQLETKIK